MTKPNVVHIDRLKPYQGGNLPNWLNAEPDECLELLQIRTAEEFTILAELDASEVDVSCEQNHSVVGNRPVRFTRPSAWTNDFEMD